MTTATDIQTRPVPGKSDFVREMSFRVSPATVIRCDEPLAKHTTLRVGGPADFFVEPATEADLAAMLRWCTENSLPVFVLGRGSNLLVRDGGVRGVVIRLSAAAFSRIEINGCRMVCGAGAKQKNVAVEARRAGLSGLEFLEGIPGSVGGALRMNAGAMGSETFQVVESLRIMDFGGNISELASAQAKASYRCCATLKNQIALSAAFKGQPQPIEEITARMQQYSAKRWAAQPAAPSAGCIFKNPEAIPAGKLIDELGLKGTSIGGARISLEHGNFLVNDGGATAQEVLELIERLRAKAKMERGIDLQMEVEIMGEA